MRHLLVLTAAALMWWPASPASAGEYTVKACFSDGRLGPPGNASWYVDSPFTPYVAAYTSCPGEGIVTRMSGASDRAPYGASARHTFSAPGGTRVKHIKARIKINAEGGWYAGFVDTTPRWFWCGNNCSSWGQYWDFSVGANTQQVFAQVTCGNGSGCPRTGQYGIIAMQDVEVTVADDAPPGVAITGGSVTQPGWHRGDQSMQFSAWDASGISTVQARVNGGQQGEHPTRCDGARPRPCLDEVGTLPLPSAAFATDGSHRVTVRVADAAGNWSENSTTVKMDQTPPGQVLEPSIDGGEGWRSSNGFSIRWRNPAQAAAPIQAVHYAMCPVGPGMGSGCLQGSARGRDINAIGDLKVPAPGEWQLSLWLQDEAGNADRERAVAAGVLRFDDTPPAASFAPQTDRDPTRVRVLASDAPSGIAGVTIEARREGEDAWRTLASAPEDGGFAAMLDDSVLPRGRYELRSRAVDKAGNERTTNHVANGDLATRTLPLRITTRLAVGRPRRVAARGANGKRRFRTVLQVRPRTPFGRTIPIRGRITMPGGNPLAGADIEVWERVKLATSAWRQVSVLRTSRTGRFKFKALRGPSRTLRFRYPGTATIRARATEVDLGVRAMTSFRANRSRVVNGEEIRFHGRLKGMQTGEIGKLLHLQVYTRGRWSTFATPRASRATGLWSYPYRFSATRGLVRYRFRVLIPREATFPYETGSSRSVRVTVRGL